MHHSRYFPNFPLRRSGMARQRGSTYLVALGVATTMVFLIGATFQFTQAVGRNAQRTMVRQNALSIADAALELEFAQWRTICQTSRSFAPGSNAFATITPPPASAFPHVSGFTATNGTTAGYVLSNYKVQAVDPLLNPMSSGTASPTMIPTNDANITTYQYLATADVTLNAVGSTPVTVKLGRVFQLQRRSPWSYAIFYDGDLEINPGPNMAISGDVHTNGGLYYGAASGKITFQSSVDASGLITLGKSPDDPSSRNNKTSAVFPDGYPIPSVAQQTPCGISHSALDATDSNTNNDSYHELIEPPNTAQSDPFSPEDQTSQRFYNLADYKISIGNTANDLSQTATVTILDANNNVVSTTSDIYKILVNGATVGGKTYTKVLTTNGTLQDNREAAQMKTTSVNVNALKAVVDAGVISTGTEGLVLYIYDSRPVKASTRTTSKMEPAIVLENGTSLPDNGLTVVSANPVYIRGDYNTGESTPSNLKSNKTDGGDPTATNYWEPAAVIGDAVNVLSNAWTSTSTSSSKATPTTINAAIMTGNIASSSASYSGGVENFIRFHEDWTNIRLTYYGSMVCFYESKQATGLWSSATYSAPYRYWNFDKRFRTQPPPGTFMTTQFSKQRWFIR